MASINERKGKDGSISFLITVFVGRDQTGKKLTKSTAFIPKSSAPTKARKEAEAFAVKYEEQVKNGGIVPNDRMTFEEAFELWKKNWLPGKTLYIQERYEATLRNHVLPHIGHMKINSIKATHIDKIIADEKGKGLAPKTVRMTFTVVNSVFRYAFKKEIIKENPLLRCDDLPPVKMKTGKDLQFFTPDQAKRFLYDALTKTYTFTVPGHKRTLKATGEEYTVPDYQEAHTIPLQWQVYFNIAIYGGFRRGEMCALTWNDVNFEKKTIDITKAMAYGRDYEQIIKAPKTEAGIREIVLPSVCFDLLSRLKKEQMIKMVEMGTAWKGHRNGIDADGNRDSFDNNFLFISFDGGQVHLSTPSHKFGEIIDLYNGTCEKEEDKLPKIRLHDLRHTALTLLLSEGVDIETVSRRAGHSKASVTLDIYGHCLPEKDQSASDKLEAILGS